MSSAANPPTANPPAAVHSAPPGRARRFLHTLWATVKRYSFGFYFLILIVLFAAALLAPRIFITIPAGHVGVLWLHFFGGTVTDRYYGEGLHIIFPWDRMFVYDARLQNDTRVYDTISSNGLAMQVEIAVRYRIDRSSSGLLHQLVGPDYPEVLVYPEVGSHTRELISAYTPEQLYTETRAFIQAEILERMVTELGSSLIGQTVRGKMVHIEDVLIRSVQLPARVAEAIERKAEQQQIMLEYDFRIAREEKERLRKRIEAEGVRDFQSIVARTITDEYLRLRGIEATKALATSNNSKTIIVGGRDGLPLILNTGDPPPAGASSLPPEEAPSELPDHGVNLPASSLGQPTPARNEAPMSPLATQPREFDPKPPEARTGIPDTYGPKGPPPRN